jgi:hypothetical protein
MSKVILLQSILEKAEPAAQGRTALFALLSLGITDSLSSGVLSASDAVRLFFHADNCLFVRRNLRDKKADEIMSRGVQLPDLFDALPAEQASRELRHELEIIRSLCLKLLDGKRLVA